MRLIQVLAGIILLLGFIGMLEGCDNCPAGEITRYLPTPTGSKSSFRLARKFPTVYFPYTCNKKKPKTKIKINPGQILEIDRPGGPVFRAIKLCVKVCKITWISAFYTICRAGLPDVTRYQTIEKEISGCQKVCFYLPPPPEPPAVQPVGVCGQQSLTRIRITFGTKPNWVGKIKVKCVEMTGCLQNSCIQL